MAARRDVNDIGVGRIDNDSADGLRVLQAEVSPMSAAIGGAPNAVADRGTLAIVGFTRAHVNDFLVGRRDGDGADGGVVHALPQRLPVVSAIGGFPKASG